MSVSKHSSHLKCGNDLLNYFKLCDPFYDAKRTIFAEKTSKDNLIEEKKRQVKENKISYSKISRQQSHFR